MAAKRNQHFVPQFYLRIFQSAPKRIHLYDLGMMEPRKDVGIKGQCYKRYFYGRDSKVEDALMELEETLSKTLRGIANSRKLPQRKSKAYRDVLTFASLQYLRTQKRTRAISHMFHKLLGRAFKATGQAPENMVPDHLYSMALSLSMIPYALEQIQDLKCHLIVSRRNAFITSDVPVYRYNQYSEAIRDRGVTGLASRGLQIFVPISPSLLLILYDGGTYKIRKLADRWFGRSVTDHKSDIDQLNLLQLHSAGRNVYFSNWEQHKDIERLSPDFDRTKVVDPEIVREFQQDDDPRNSLLVTFERMVDMSLNLSFMTIKRRANQIPLYRRPDLYRGGRLHAADVQRRDSDAETITFSRFIGES